MKKKLLIALSCTALFLGLSARPASADEFFYSFTGPDNGSGYMSANAVTGHPGEFQVTNITGNLNGIGISSLIFPGLYPTPPAANDNLLFYPASAQFPITGTSAYVDIFGLSFQLVNNAQYNLYYGSFGTGFPTGYNLTYGANLQFNDLLTSFTLTDLSLPTVTPEPSSLILLGTGALGFAGAFRRRFSSAA